ncbi:MAG: transcription termination factor NusA, partial [bacterium]|nr:transcription termination factor NusA [bacterium]
VVDESTVKIIEEDEAEEKEQKNYSRGVKVAEEKETTEIPEVEDTRVRYNPEHHIFLADAQKIKKGAALGDEIIFPLESKDDYGRIAAQTAKQVIIQRIREAERVSVVGEYEKRKGEIVNGTIQRVERGTIYIDLGRVIGALPQTEQIPGEYYRQGERVRAYLYSVEETPRDITLRLSRTHPQFLQKLFEIEAPEVASGVVEIKGIAREPGARSKIAVMSHDEHIDPVGSCVGGRGVRVGTVMSELGGEKIDIIEWAPEPAQFIERALSPAHVLKVTLEKDTKNAIIEVDPDQYSLAIGRGGQNARLAARLTGWKIDIRQKSVKYKSEESTSEEIKTEGTKSDTVVEEKKSGQGTPEEKIEKPKKKRAARTKKQKEPK